MKELRAPGIALFVVGVVFLVLGSSGQRAFVGVGAALIVFGLILMLRRPGRGR